MLHDPHDQESLEGSAPALAGGHDTQGFLQASPQEPLVSLDGVRFEEIPAALAPMEPEAAEAQMDYFLPSDQPLEGVSDIQSEAPKGLSRDVLQSDLAEARPTEPEIGLCQEAEPAPGPPSQPEALPGAAEAAEVEPPAEPDLPAQPVALEQPQPSPAEPQPGARRISQRMNSSPKDTLAQLVPNKGFVIYLSYNDYRFKVECKTTSENFSPPFHRKRFSKVFTKDTWKESLVAVHKHWWEKWSIISDTSPLDRSRQDSIDDSVFDSLPPIIDRMPPPTRY